MMATNNKNKFKQKLNKKPCKCSIGIGSEKVVVPPKHLLSCMSQPSSSWRGVFPTGPKTLFGPSDRCRKCKLAKMIARDKLSLITGRISLLTLFGWGDFSPQDDIRHTLKHTLQHSSLAVSSGGPLAHKKRFNHYESQSFSFDYCNTLRVARRPV